jgi:hypothetical protein
MRTEAGERQETRTGHKRCAYKMMVRKPEGKRPLRRPWHRWEDNIRTDVREKGGKVWTGCFWLRTGTAGELL